MNQIRINKDHLFSIPQSWDEMTDSQFVDVARVHYVSTDVITFRLKLLFTWLEINILLKYPSYQTIFSKKGLFPVRLKNRSVVTLTALQVSDLISTLDFLFESNKKNNIYLVSHRVNNPFPSLKHRHKEYYGPDDRLTNLIFNEFMSCENHYFEFLKTKDDIHLNKLLAVLFRKEMPDFLPHSLDYSGDRREPFNDHLVETNAKRLKAVSPVTKLAIFFFYQGCRNFIISTFTNVFNGSASKKSAFGMLPLVDALSNGDVTKNNAIKNSLLYDVMLRLEQATIQNKEFESKLKSKRNG